MKYICTIHDTIKPDICKNWPSHPGELKVYPDCTLYFDDAGNLQGECSQCGVCCLTPYIYPPGYDRKYRDEPCPYLQKVIDGD